MRYLGAASFVVAVLLTSFQVQLFEKARKRVRDTQVPSRVAGVRTVGWTEPDMRSGQGACGRLGRQAKHVFACATRQGHKKQVVMT